MSGSDRRRDFKAVDWVYPVIGILLAVGIAWGIGFSQGGENIKRRSAPHQHAQSAEQGTLEHCAGREGSSLVECVEEQIEAAEETARTEQDLTAQQQAAWGSMIGAMWGGLGLCITAIGTALLYQQIVLTRKAVEDTGNATKAMQRQNEIAERVQRPWVSISIENIEFTRFGNSLRLNLDIVTKNVGLLVARNYHLCYKFIYSDHSDDDEVKRIWKEFDKRKRDTRKILMPNDIEAFPFWSSDYLFAIKLADKGNAIQGSVVPTLVISVLYQSDLTGDVWLRTDKAYVISFRDQRGGYNARIDHDFKNRTDGTYVALQHTSSSMGN